MPHPRWTALMIALVSIGPSRADGADTESTQAKPRRWSLAIHLGFGSSPGSADLEEAMHAAGFGVDTGGQSHPFTRMEWPGVSLELGYEMTSRWNIAMQLGVAPQFNTLGFGSGDQQGDLHVRRKVTGVGLVFGRTIGLVRLGVGPALHAVRARQTAFSHDPWDGRSKAGLIAQAAARIPTKSSAFFEVAGRYRLVGRVTVGPFTKCCDLGPVPFPPTDPRFDDWSVSAGGGVRF